MPGSSTQSQLELLELQQIENQKKDPGFNKKSKEMTKKMIEENILKNSKNSDRRSILLEKLLEKNTTKSKGLKAGGRVEYKSGGGVGCAKRGFNKKILKKGKK
jgi:hypothetical protein